MKTFKTTWVGISFQFVLQYLGISRDLFHVTCQISKASFCWVTYFSPRNSSTKSNKNLNSLELIQIFCALLLEILKQWGHQKSYQKLELEKFIQTVKGQNNFRYQNAFLTCSWWFFKSNKLEYTNSLVNATFGSWKKSC